MKRRHHLVAAVALATLALLPARALAASPDSTTQEVYTEQVFTGDESPCGFPLTLVGAGTVNITTHYDASGAPVSQFVEGALVHTLSSPWATLSGNGPAPVHIDLTTGQQTVTGNEVHFTVQGAGVVLGAAGRLVLDANGVELSYTGLNVSPDRLPALCAALGPPTS